MDTLAGRWAVSMWLFGLLPNTTWPETDRASCTNPMNVIGLISLSCHATTGSRTVNVVTVLVAMYVVCVMHEPLENMVTATVTS